MRLLAVAAAAGAGMSLADCARLRPVGPAPPVSSSAAASQRIVVIDHGSYYAQVPGLAAAFNRAHREVVVTSPKQGFVAGRSAGVSLGPAGPGQGGVGPLAFGQDEIPLAPALKPTNFNPVLVQPAVLSTFEWKGQLYGLPVQQNPLGMLWRRDVFTAAGLDPPTVSWTVADLQSACTEIAGLIAGGKVAGLRQVLWPGVGQGDWLWPAFALGYGGTVWQGSAFALDPAALQGLGVLVDLVARYGSAGSPKGASGPELLSMSAIRFSAWTGPPDTTSSTLGTGGSDARWAWARLPRFPAVPVVPTVPVGIGIFGNIACAPQTDLQAAGAAVAWLYGSEPQALLAAWGAVPVLADPGSQVDFWRTQPAEIEAVGDWQHFLPYDAGWLAEPYSSYIARALLSAVAQPASLPELIASAEAQANRWVALELKLGGYPVCTGI